MLVAALIGSLAAVPGTAAAAQSPNWDTQNSTKWLTTDSRTPDQAVTTGDARVGSWRDAEGKHHIGKSYFTFDLTRLTGTQLFTASIRTPELSANDCEKPRATEVWVVEQSDTITWANPPREVVRAGGPTAASGCTTPWLNWDVLDVVKQAIGEGRTSLTVAVRVSEEFQGDVAYGRTHNAFAVLNTTFNTPPGTPTNLHLEHLPCTAEPTYFHGTRPYVSATASDQDGTYGLDGRLAFWPVDAPDQRVEVQTQGRDRVTGWFPEGMVQDGGTYAFAARAEDGFANSEWSAPCVFTADLTRPANAPTVTSTVYRENGGPPGDGGDGIPGDFTFSADGDQDVVAFAYWGIGIQGGRVAADQPGGSATVTVTPDTDGLISIEVSGVDRAGHQSPVRTYLYWVASTAPSADVSWFEIGVPRDVVLTAGQVGATTFVYRLDGGAEQTVPVGEDGTGRVTLVFPEPGQTSHAFTLWTLDATGSKSGVYEHYIHVDQVQPWVDVDVWAGLVGEKRVFTVTPNRTGVVSYVYRIGEEPEVVVPAAPDGSLTFEYTPTVPGYSTVLVASVNGAGVRSGWGESALIADAPAPAVTSTEYPGYPEGGGPGVTGTFAFSSPQLPVVSYRYRFNDEAEQTIAAGAEGTASVQWTPSKPGYHSLKVRGVTATGVETDESYFSFRVKALPPTVTSPQFPDGGPSTAKVGQPIEFTVTPALPGSHEVLWSISFNPPQVAPVGPDGKARFTYTPLGSFQLTVSSRTPGGVVSGDVTRTYSVPQ
ncbi:hypothetical protein F4560_004748 [Saccharothrix ecbatanensis]|uniref:DNRLRE domain-containing protein n=1 Tax=Saccharothrix ecbatanensis TaxID=1105145 RepID=A0A7W9HMP8_9PSEU|nr:hypothetical protein [Saccharothrix ecbatanensis]MBB5804980.1 hypothetical protein [Saccharothrix ecbatanensis]